MESLFYILVALCTIAIVFSVWSFITIKKHLNRNRWGSAIMQDERYFELKSKQEYLIYSGALVVAIISFIGYGSIKDAKDELTKQFTQEKSALDSLRHSVDSVSKAAEEKLDSINYLAANTTDTFNILKTNSKGLNQTIEAMRNKVNELAGKNILTQNFYIVDDLTLQDWGYDTACVEGNICYRIPFAKLKTITGEPLPKFISRPSLIAFTIGGGQIEVYDLNTTYFTVRSVETVTKLTKQGFKQLPTKFSVWISLKDF